MPQTPDELYAALAQGTAQPPTDPRLVGAIRQRVVDAQRHTDPDVRQDALQVCVSMISMGGLEWMYAFAEDPDPALREKTLDAAFAAEPEGMAIVRAFIADKNPDLSLRVLAALTERLEPTATTRVRSLLGADDARVRAAAAHLLGYIAGQVVRPQLDRLVREDPSEQVRWSAQKALQRIEGTLPRTDPKPWRAQDVSTAPSTPEPDTVQAKTAQPRDLPAIQPDTTADTTGDEQPAPSAGESLMALGTGHAPEASGVATVHAMSPHAVSEQLASLRERSDVDSLIVAAHAVNVLGRASYANDVKRQLTHSDPRVRAASAHAVATLGGPAVLPALARLLADPDVDVQSAAIHAVAKGAARHNVAHMAKQWLSPLTAKEGPLADLAADALASLTDS